MGDAVDDIKNRFNDKAMKLFIECAIFDSTHAFLNATILDIEFLCKTFGIDSDACVADFKSFKHYITKILNATGSNKPYQILLAANVGYNYLRQLAELIMCVPISTASVERSFSTMNRIHTKLRNKLGEESIDHLMRIACEGPENPPLSFLNSIIDLYAKKKPRRIRLI